MVDEQGTAVSCDCTLCHSIQASESPAPFQFLQPVPEPDEDGRLPADAVMHRFLQEEFVGGPAGSLRP